MKKPTSFKIEWVAHEYENKERSSDWFWAVGIVAFSLAITSVIFGNIIFGILILTGTFSLMIFASREPEEIDVTINEVGVTRENVLYPYDSLASFWIDVDHSHPKIMLRSEKFFIPLIVLPLSTDVDPEEIADRLSQFIEEEVHELPFLERVLDYLGF